MTRLLLAAAVVVGLSSCVYRVPESEYGYGGSGYYGYDNGRARHEAHEEHERREHEEHEARERARNQPYYGGGYYQVDPY